MAEKLLKTKPRKIAAKKAPADSARKLEEIVVVGNYKTGQLDWIRENGVYNWPVREGDEFTPEQFAQIKELWLYASAKSQRHVFTAEFIGKMTAAEFRAKYPTYAKLSASKQKQYYVFKTGHVDYPQKLGSQIVLARAADFGKRCAKVKKAIEQFKQNGEFAPLAAYLPKELGDVPHKQLRVCEAAVQICEWSPVSGMSPVQEKIASIVMSVAAFGRERGMSASDAYCYLNKYSGVAFLDEHYSMSRCYSEEMMDESLSKVCRNHGGTLK